MAPDFIVHNARILTMDAAAPRAEAAAIGGGSILALGANNEIRALAAPHTRLFDAQGCAVTPGFVEAHMHLFGGADSRRHAQLGGEKGFDRLCEVVRAHAARNPDEGLLFALNASYTLLRDNAEITRHDLDRVLPDRPLLLIAGDFHTGWANTVALERAGILGGREVGVGNEIVMASDGTATGELREGDAMAPVRALTTSGGRERLGLDGVEPGPELTAADRDQDRETIAAGLRYCAELGITTIHNMDGNFYQLELLSELEAEGRLLCRTQIPYHLTNVMPLSNLELASEMHHRFRSDTLYSGRVKIFVDGVIESGTAAMLADYADRPGWRGEPLFTPEAFRDAAVEADRRGLQISVHAIGDAAVRITLDGYQAAREANGARDSRHRVEHIEVVDPADIPRFAELGVIASMQPPHYPGANGSPLEPFLGRIGAARWPCAFPWRALWDAGARIAFATDWPVSPLAPMRSIRAAVTRRPWANGVPDHRASLTEAIAAYTAEGAYAGFMEDKCGRLAPGMQADLVVLDADIEATPEEDLHKVAPALTLCAGRATFEA